jgi:hypothetical protein
VHCLLQCGALLSLEDRAEFAVARPALAVAQIRAWRNSAAVWLARQPTPRVVGRVRGAQPIISRNTRAVFARAPNHRLRGLLRFGRNVRDSTVQRWRMR